MKLAIACDHGAFELKEALKEACQQWGHEVEDFGSYDTSAVDYPDTVYPACVSVRDGKNDLGIVMCGSGIGASIVANKTRGIRCALVNNSIELAKITRLHNDANVLAMGGRFNTIEEGLAIAKAFLDTPFSGEERHLCRIQKISTIEIEEDR
mgnify:CR=1 FL=1